MNTLLFIAPERQVFTGISVNRHPEKRNEKFLDLVFENFKFGYLTSELVVRGHRPD